MAWEREMIAPRLSPFGVLRHLYLYRTFDDDDDDDDDKLYK